MGCDAAPAAGSCRRALPASGRPQSQRCECWGRLGELAHIRRIGNRVTFALEHRTQLLGKISVEFGLARGFNQFALKHGGTSLNDGLYSLRYSTPTASRKVAQFEVCAAVTSTGSSR